MIFDDNFVDDDDDDEKRMVISFHSFELLNSFDLPLPLFELLLLLLLPFFTIYINLLITSFSFTSNERKCR